LDPVLRRLEPLEWPASASADDLGGKKPTVKRRGGPSQLVPNEKRVLMGAAYLTLIRNFERFWVDDVVSYALPAIEEAQVNPATVSRALSAMVARNWMSARWDTEVSGDVRSSKPRLYYSMTPEGIRAAHDLVIQEREQLPKWVYEPDSVGLAIAEPHWARRQATSLQGGGGRSLAKVEASRGR
jgi:hypothetical protein